jgi:hypothetical protein
MIHNLVCLNYKVYSTNTLVGCKSHQNGLGPLTRSESFCSNNSNFSIVHFATIWQYVYLLWLRAIALLSIAGSRGAITFMVQITNLWAAWRRKRRGQPGLHLIWLLQIRVPGAFS